MSGLEWTLEEVEGRREQEVAALTAQLAAAGGGSPEEQEAAALNLQLASLKQELDGARQEEERLRQELELEQKVRQKSEQFAVQARSREVDLQDTVDRLLGEKEEGAGEAGGFEEVERLNQSLNLEIASLRSAIVEGRAGVGEGEVARLQARVQELEQGIRRPRLDSRESIDRELQLPSETGLLEENFGLKEELDSSRRERRLLAARIQEWQQELGREQVTRS